MEKKTNTGPPTRPVEWYAQLNSYDVGTLDLDGPLGLIWAMEIELLKLLQDQTGRAVQ